MSVSQSLHQEANKIDPTNKGQMIKCVDQINELFFCGNQKIKVVSDWMY